MPFNVTKLAPTGNRYNSDTARAMIQDMYTNRGGANWLPQDALAAIGRSAAPNPNTAWNPPIPTQPTTAFGPNVGVGAGVGPAISVAGGPQTGGYDPSPMQTPMQPMQTPIGGGFQGGMMPRQPMQTPVGGNSYRQALANRLRNFK